jgi:hypothetical protein
MTTTKRSAKKKQANQEKGPSASRPYIPGYGIPKHNKGLLSWPDVSERINSARHYH